MTSPDPTLGEELAFQIAQIAEARRRGHPDSAARARFYARAHANLASLTDHLPPPPETLAHEGTPAWPAKQKPSA